MRPSTPCPDVRSFWSLLSDELSVPEKETLLRHLEACDVCAAKVRTLPEQSRLLSWIQQAKSPSRSPEDRQLALLMGRLIPSTGGASSTDSALATHDIGPARLLSFACAGCGKQLRVPVQAAGSKMRCPLCGQVISALADEPARTMPSDGAETALLPPSLLNEPRGGSASQAAAPQEQNPEYDLICSFLAPPQAAGELGRLGSYRVLEVLGSGGMGVVFRAEDPQLRRPVALKAMLPALAANESARRRFLREARAAASIKHEHIVTIYQVSEDRGVPFLAMEFLEGESLDDRAKRMGQLPLAEVLRIGREIASGLEAAHMHGLIHRDIKPANIWIEKLPGERGTSSPRFRTKILDFGLARSAEDDVHLTQSGAILGTPAYMSPEQASGETVDTRCDLYSLGGILYRLCAGQLPFRCDNTMTLLRALALEHPKSPRQLNPDVPPALADLILRLLAKDPARRPASAGEVVEALKNIEANRSAEREATPTPSPRPHELSVTRLEKRRPKPTASQSSPPRRPRALLVVLAASFLLMTVLTVLLIIQLGGPQEGTVTIETVDPNVELVFRSGDREITVRDKKNGEEIKIPIGTYEIELKGGKEGLRLATNHFTLKRGGRELVKVTRQAGAQPVPAQEFEPPPPPRHRPPPWDHRQPPPPPPPPPPPRRGPPPPPPD